MDTAGQMTTMARLYKTLGAHIVLPGTPDVKHVSRV